ncbi:acyl-CoA dehydrogenase family protein [Agromyces silvae]|uniref:acyl-CoA dehydrogenase family protein n=1 Tax=Agromyces silvae TaxID=3388266 RepID=UPI00280A8A1A|nr:acyl-CoA dehydrogenase family protein [Agromyces protaetiae]
MTIPSLLRFADPGASVRSRFADAVTAVADHLRPDAVQREIAGADPHDEIDLLRRFGLLSAPVPAAFGGGGIELEEVVEAVRLIARVDGSVAALLGYHYQRVHSIADAAGGGDPQIETRRARLLTDTAREGWYWAATGSAQDAEFTLEPHVDGGYLVSGRKGFATGASVADRLVSAGSLGDQGRVLRFAIDPSRPGIRFAGDWDNIGQRLTASGGIELDGYHVQEEDVFGSFPRFSGEAGESFARDPQASLIVPAFQLLFVHLYLGLAEGALGEASGYVRAQSRPWVHAVADSPADDPYVLRHVGESAVQLSAASALADQATAELAYGRARGAALTYDERSRIAVRIAAAKVASTQVALATTARVFEATGARSTQRAVGLDRFWREARTHTLHDPVEYKIREVGDAVLNGRSPEPSHYR